MAHSAQMVWARCFSACWKYSLLAMPYKCRKKEFFILMQSWAGSMPSQ